MLISATIASTMDQVALVRQKTDIVQLIQEFIQIKKAGRNFKANCPFHGEKTPSFVISPERQIWHCFGCQKGGDVFTFLMEYEHIEFPEALRMLAEKAGIVLEHQQFDSAKTSKKERLYAINRLAAEFYHYLLTKHDIGKKALGYLTKNRHLKLAAIKTFQIGFAPKTSNALVTYLIKKKGYTKEDLLDAGLAYERNGKLYDFFFDRIIFALTDHRDNIVGFSGRIMSNRTDTSKYINTRETLVYHKGSTFFGFNIAKEAIKKDGFVLLMEGEFDVISSFQEGVSNAVAVKGTALTEDQVNLLARFTKKVAVCFDMDKAGQDALRRSIPLLEKKELLTTVIVLPNGKDPDESIQDNPITYKQAVKEGINVYDFLLEQAVAKFDPKTAEGKRAITSDLLPVYGLIENEIVKEHYLHLLGDEIGISQDSMQKEIDKQKKQAVVKKDILFPKQNRSREEVLEEYLVALIVQSEQPMSLIATALPFLTSYVWHSPALQKIIEKLQQFLDNNEFSQEHFAASLPKELETAFDTCFLMPLPDILDGQKYIQEVKKVAKDLQEVYVRRQIKVIGDTIKQQERTGSVEELESLQQQLSHFVGILAKKD